MNIDGRALLALLLAATLQACGGSGGSGGGGSSSGGTSSGGTSSGGTSSGGTSSGGTSSGGTSSGGTSSGGTSSGGTSSGGTSSGGSTNYALTIGRSGTGSGLVTSTPSGISCGSTCTGTFGSGTTVTLTATAGGGSSFTGWSGDCTGTGACVLGMTAARTVTAGFAEALVGWATQGGTVTGGGSATPVTVTTLAALNGAAGGTGAAVIRVSGTISGDVSIGSNKTIEGVDASATIQGSIRMSGSANVILRNLNVVGYNCNDSPSDCQNGADAIGVEGGAHHLWFDHLAVSDGSDGNMDFTHAADDVTVSWTKFFYTGRPAGIPTTPGASLHQFSNLIGHSDTNATEDAGHLRITFHHCWWADGVRERMPRVRFGQVHVFNSLYTAVGDNYCIAPGQSASVLVENNVFLGVKDPVDLTYGDGAATVSGNLFTGVSGNTSGRGTAFTPPYAYTLDAASSVEAAVRAGAGPR